MHHTHMLMVALERACIRFANATTPSEPRANGIDANRESRQHDEEEPSVGMSTSYDGKSSSGRSCICQRANTTFDFRKSFQSATNSASLSLSHSHFLRERLRPFLLLHLHLLWDIAPGWVLLPFRSGVLDDFTLYNLLVLVAVGSSDCYAPRLFLPCCMLSARSIYDLRHRHMPAAATSALVAGASFANSFPWAESQSSALSHVDSIGVCVHSVRK